jgi:hypothetical protein
VVINYDSVYSLLTAACPAYDRSTQMAEAHDRDGEFLRVGQFVRFLVQLLSQDETSTFVAVFSVVEWVLEDGDEEARGLISDGFFSDLADVELYRGLDHSPKDFVPWLGPHALATRALRGLL